MTENLQYADILERCGLVVGPIKYLWRNAEPAGKVPDEFVTHYQSALIRLLIGGVAVVTAVAFCADNLDAILSVLG